MKKLFSTAASACVLAFAATGCSTMDPYTGEKETSKATTGAAVGAVAGAVVGEATSSKSDRKKGAITGAVAGGAIGGGVGYYMDRQEKELRDRLVGSGVQVVRDGNNIQLVMPGNITFATNRSEIRTEFHNVLDSVALVLKEFDKTRIKISGHTDNTGGSDLNQRLSEQRAGSVKQYLDGRGVARGRMTAIGYSYRYPIATNDTAQGRQLNRRVELELEPIE